ncbi:hypothetical protein SELMODRAFT_94851 [Selaginella moellendorffii]|uniref:Uncharacterized protein n=1 Tax=Selaginella moellendorffii TaxID=88036 RepID=D8RJQ2_SELML|nr:hypothetical protein SELMODRAFT_94851 [Selaginella moellendorffii]
MKVAEDILRYQFYVESGVDERFIAPIRERWTKRAVDMVGKYVKRGLSERVIQATLRRVLEEVQHEYLLSMRKAIVDYVLQQILEVVTTGFIGKTRTIQILSAEWREAVLSAHGGVSGTLHKLNPQALELAFLWQDLYAAKFLIDTTTPEFFAGAPYELDDFIERGKQCAGAVRESLDTEWLSTASSVLEQAVPIPPNTDLIGFYEAMAVLMSNQIRRLVEDSVVNFVRFIDVYKGEIYEIPRESIMTVHHKLTPRLQRFKELFRAQVEPSYDALELGLVEVLEYAVAQSAGVHRVDAEDLEPSRRLLSSMAVDDELVGVAKGHIRQVVQSNVNYPKELMDKYVPFEALANMSAQAFAQEFKAQEKPIQEYEEVLKQFSEKEIQIEATSANVVDCGIVRVKCKEYKDILIKKARYIALLLKEQVLAFMHAANTNVLERMEHIAREIIKIPTNSEEALIFATRFLAASPTELSVLERILGENRQREDFLDRYQLNIPETEFRTMLIAYEWPKRVRAVIDVHTKRITEEYEHYETQLKQRRIDFFALLESLDVRVKSYITIADLDKIEAISDDVTDLNNGLQAALETSEALNAEETLFGVPPTKFTQIQQMITALDPFFKLWTVGANFKRLEEEWMSAPFFSLDTEKIEGEVSTMFRVIFKLVKQFGEDYPEPGRVASAVKAQMEKFKETFPLLRCLCNPGLRARHFEKISQIVGFELKAEDTISFRQLLRLNIDEHLTKLEEISEHASKEYSLERALNQMEADWAPIAFEYALYKNTGTHILKGGPIEEAQILLEEHIIKTQNMFSSAFAQFFSERIGIWLKKITLMQDVLREWLKMQAAWMYLEPIFGSPDIIEQMPKEGTAFHATDKVWRRIVAEVIKTKCMLEAADIPNLLADLKEGNAQLEIVNKGLNHYLETKRLAFPRFFFLSNDELLEILSETKDPLRVQPFLKKCFEGINQLEFQPNLDITAMLSVESEKVPFTRTHNPKSAGGNVEKWLIEVEAMMKECLRAIVVQAAADYAVEPRESWILKWPGMIVLCGSQIYWTEEVASAIIEGGTAGLQKYEDKCTDQLQSLVKLVRGDISNMERLTIGALVVIDVHARDVVTLLKEKQVSSETDFEWLSQLRYYLEENEVIVKMVNAARNYGYEYLGNSSRLVITPLTDRCYRTLMGALHLNLGGAPEGPAGTGKTETTKDLAKALAMQCVVFNCSDGLDYLAMGKFFKGLAASGAWACFDEFNRIDLEVLSVIAQQILTIQRAIMAGVKRFMFEGTDLPLIPTCTSFITMNPGYAGRSELPDNLKALFRPVAMMVPNYAMIGEIILYSFGYGLARDMARKLVATYRLCSEQLSSQDHYDYGMRAVIAVLRAAGNLKRKYRDADESVLVLRAIRDVNLPKFLSHDIPLFEGIMADLFPGVVLPKPDYDAILLALNNNCVKMNLIPIEPFIRKILELYEMIIVRHGLMIVGYSFGAKTCMYKVLADALTEMNQQNLEQVTWYNILNPKSITMGQLYGQFDPVSHEWTDGVLATTFRNQSADTTPNRKWLIFDGPVDAIWIENMNTVLDDNKKLCLMSGEIIQMSGTMNLIFEVQDLAAASPATVSRCGMVYVEPSAIGWRPIVTSWLTALPEVLQGRYSDQISKLCEWLLPPCLRCVQKNCKLTIAMQEQNMVQSMLRIIWSLMDPQLTDKVQSEKMDGNLKATWVDSIFLFALVWAVGACTDHADRPKFDVLLRKLIANQPPEDYKQYIVAAARKVAQNFPDGKLVYDFVFNKDRAKWVPWTDLVDETPPSPEADFARIIVSTADTVKYLFLVNELVMHTFPLLLVGPTGTGKSQYVKQYLMKLDTSKFQSMFFNFSAQTSANQTQDIIDSKLVKRKQGIFGPQKGKQCIILVDDLSMPALEKYGAQPPIELLRQWMDHKGWYDRNDLSFKNIIDTQFISAMAPPGGGRNAVTNRYLRHFNVICVTPFSDATLSRIFSSLVDFWMKRSRYPPQVVKLRPPMIAATIDIYQTVQRELLPTPEKSHYTYNLRDLSKVFLGLQFAPAETDNVYKIMRLWANECLRIFYDRLINDKDRDWFCELLAEMFEKHYKERYGKVFASFTHSEIKKGDSSPGNMKYFMAGDFMVPGADPAQYDEITDEEGLMRVMQAYLEDYNQVNTKQMNLVLFQFAIQHISRICRVIKQPGGNALLVGVGGSGRQSFARLAAFIEGFDIFQVEIAKNYGMSEWREDLGKMLRKAGEADKRVMFLFVDTQIKMEGFVEDINSLLNTGEVPNLYDSADLSSICEAVRPRAKRAKRDGSRAELYAFFVDECSKNMRIALAFSPIGGAFRDRLRKFPSLVNCCTIDWFSGWPTEALRSVAARFLDDVNVDDKLIPGLVDMTVHFHISVQDLSLQYFTVMRRYSYVTPTSFLELINLFKSLLMKKQAEVSGFKKRYEMGLQKLESSANDVNTMQKELEELQPKLVQSTAEVTELLQVIDTETTEANKVREVVLVEEAAASIKAAEAKAIKDDTEAELAAAMPMLEAALKALDTLSKNDISELKGMKSPPAGVKLVMEAVCIMKSIKPTRMKDPGGSGKMVEDYWESSKKMLADADFLKSLREYDKDNISYRWLITLEKCSYIANPNMEPTKVSVISKAAFGLCSWIIAMEAYDRVAKVVAPKQAALKIAEAEYEEVMSALRVKQASLRKVELRLAELDAQLNGAQFKKKTVEDEASLCATKITRANQLMSGLGGEKTRWTAQAQMFGETYIKLTGDILLSAGMIAYLGVFTPTFRDQAVADWLAVCKGKKIPCSTDFVLSNILADPVEIRAWNICGLPKDQCSIDNGTIIKTARRWGLMIDPQGQANKWIKNLEASNALIITKLSDNDFLRKLEVGIQFGKPVLVENVGEELDPAIEPILLQLTFKQSGTLCIKLGDNTLEYSSKFRLYLTTKLRNPHYSPETSAKVVTLLNFMITSEGLFDQLLGIAVAKERPDLEEEKNQLILQSASNKKQLKEIEDKTLEVLSQEGNILEDETGIQVLSQSKILSEDISAKQKIAEETEVKIDNARSGYKPVAKVTAILFFCVSDMANIEPMYQYSLPWFIDLFEFSIMNSEKSPDLGARLRILNAHFLYTLYCNVCRSLFEKDKLLFVFLMTVKLFSAEGKLSLDELRFFMTGGIALDKQPAKPAGEATAWLSDKAWGELYRLSQKEAFSGLDADIIQQADKWRVIFDSPEPHMEPLPLPWNIELDSFQKMVVLRCIRPDKLVLATANYVAESLGSKFIEPLPLNLESCYKDASATTPLVFVLSPGSDPMSMLLKLAADKEAKLETVSLGQGQGPVAIAILNVAAKEGSWVALQNCHLAVSWMATLEKYWENELTKEKTHKDFRLWLTSYPSDAFPVAILQNAVKMTNEPPNGLKANLTGSYFMYPISDIDFFSNCSKGPEWRRMLYGLCFFHAFVQERRKFGPLGWNIPYEYNESDLRISVRQLKMFIEEYPDRIPYKALNYLTGECNYGGRVTDDHDRRTLITILEGIYCDAVHDDNYSFSESGLFRAPPDGTYENFLEFIKRLPNQPRPEVFGFHDNATISKDLNETARLLDSLLLVSPAASEGGSSKKGGAPAMSPDDVMLGISSDILGKLPGNFDIEAVQNKYPVVYLESMNTVLCQELERFNKLLSIIRSSLLELQKAVKGLIVMSAELDQLGRSLLDGKIPAMWAAKSYPSRKPLASYVSDLLERVAFFHDWVVNGPPSVYWLSGLNFTQSFLTGAKQNFARSAKVPIDMIDFEFQVMEDPAACTIKPEIGVYVRGLFLEGARWDYNTHYLGESEPKVLYSPCPILWLVPTELSKFGNYPHYLSPLYKTSDRRGILSTTGHSTNFVMEVKLPSNMPQAHWVKRGVALLSQLDD